MSLRILFCTRGYSPADAGGAERQARLQAEELVRRGHHVTVVCPRTPGTSSGRDAGVDIVRLPIIPRRGYRTITSLIVLAAYLVLRVRRYDIVHVHLANLQADVAVILGAVLRRPVYVKVAAGGPFGEVDRFRRLSVLTRYVGLRGASRVQAISDEIEQDLLGIGILKARIIRNPNGIDFDRIPGMAARPDPEARSLLGLPIDSKVVLYLGRFAVYKGVDDLIAAWRALGPDCGHLLLVGATALEPAPAILQSDDIRIHLWTSDSGVFLRAADVFVLPSHAEGMSNALLEAMASGLPCIATRVGAAESMIVDGTTGVLIDPGDREALQDAIRDLLDDPHKRKRLGDAAALSVRARYSIKTVVDIIERTYGEILAS